MSNNNPELPLGRTEQFFRLFERCEARFTLVSRNPGWIEHIMPCEEAVEFLAQFASKSHLAVEDVTVVHRYPLFLFRKPREAPPPESQRLSVPAASQYIVDQKL